MVSTPGATLVSLVVLSSISLVAVFSLGLREEILKALVRYLVSFSAGALFGTAFLHMIPNIVAESGFGLSIGVYLLAGIAISFVIEGYLHWHHHTMEVEHEPFSYVILLGDGLHNLIDGIVIASSYIASVPLGFTATVAVGFHKIPKEIGDFGALVHGGFSPRRAIVFNVLTNLTAFLGAFIVFGLAGAVPGMTTMLIPFAAGTFIYIAGSDLLPEVKEETDVRISSIHVVSFVGGIGTMYLLSMMA